MRIPAHVTKCFIRLTPISSRHYSSISRKYLWKTNANRVHSYSTKPKVAAATCDTDTDNVEKAVQQEQFETKVIQIKVPSDLSKFRDQNQFHSVTKQAAVNSETTSKKLKEGSNIPTESDTQDFTIFLKHCGVKLDVDNGRQTKEVEVKLPDEKKLLQLYFDYDDGLKIDSTSPSKHVESVSEYTWREVKLDYSKLPQYYMKLSKIRLTGLVVITTMAGYAVAPDPFYLSTFLLCTFGTALTSCSANAVNQYLEVPFDSQMNRTKNRVLVRGHLSPLHAVTFAVITGSTGLVILTLGVNPLTATLGAFNLGLYTLVYTPMKRYSILNTWVGSIVGAIPPMMGWTACTGMLEPGALLLGAILYAWQFPHFNALSWNLRPDYSRGGYRMASVVRPELCKRVALRYSIGMIGLCSAAPLVHLTTWTFAVDSLPLNVWLAYLAWNFYRKGDSNSSRRLFRFTLVHIPALMILMLIGKKSGRDNNSENWQLLQSFKNLISVT
ncbi:protoheme IX farnesyltransferase, mitochondrial-like [Mercenaria mercenaria]|uniref:protoheme IX farnesyltransferase, mitochondrial-like n=1 Tax=Mercenaria mercenaria TaxID=6596 RepID=UPI00234F8BB0|nr:protoheme IX farnesyltransferase, mitochondrial-like [Mercenaria mercenaria]